MKDLKKNNFALKSESMNEMLTHPPSWLIHSGSGIIMIILLIAFCLSWTISYPDEINGKATVSTTEPSIEMTNHIFAQIKKIAVRDGQNVNQNQMLVEFDNQAKTEHIQKAIQFLLNLDTIKYNENTVLPSTQNGMKLGVFQDAWISLEKAISEWNTEYHSGIENEKLSTIYREISYREQLKTISSRKIKLSELEYNLISDELMRTEQLLNESIVTRQSLNQEKRTENQAMQTVQIQKEQFVQNLIELNSLRKELIQFKHEQKQLVEHRKNNLNSLIATLKIRLLDWKKLAVLYSPIKGKVVFNTHLQTKQFYKPGEASIVVVPNKSTFYVSAIIPAYGAGKVKVGQKAIIELTDYPKTEFGILAGFVVNKTQIEKEGNYEVRIRLPKQLRTSYGKLIPAKPRLIGSIKIITKEKRLLARLIEKLTDLIR